MRELKIMNKILITGHLGFVGRHLTKKLDYLGIEWDGFDLNSGDDIRNKFQLDSKFLTGNYSLVIHLAALTGVSRSDKYSKEYIDTNILGTKNILDMLKKYRVPNIIFYSSSSVYGGNKTEKGILEEDSYSPLSVYGITKVSGEFLVKNSGINYSIIRPFAIYGENGKRFSVIYKWIDQINANKKITFFGDGSSSRGYTYIQDIVKATLTIIELMQENKLKSRIFNIGGEENISLNMLYKIFKEFCDENKIKISKDVSQKFDFDITSSFADVSKAKRLLGYSPEKSFKSNVRGILTNELL